MCSPVDGALRQEGAGWDPPAMLTDLIRAHTARRTCHQKRSLDITGSTGVCIVPNGIIAWSAMCPHVPSFATMRPHVPPCATVPTMCHHAPPCATVPPCATMRHHAPPCTTMHHYAPPFTTICPHALLEVIYWGKSQLTRPSNVKHHGGELRQVL
jgi:hypothetical protein